MSNILVTYATRAGSTSEVAAGIGEVLRAEGATVVVQPVQLVRDLDGYDAVVIGSAIRMGHWLPEAVAFVKKHKEQLSQLPLAYFLVSGFLREGTPEMRMTVLSYLNPVRDLVEPACIGLFAGKIDYSALSWFDRTVARKVGAPEGDWRDWEAIRAWARSLQPTILSHI